MYKTQRRQWDAGGTTYTDIDVAASGTAIIKRSASSGADIVLFTHGTAGIAPSCSDATDMALLAPGSYNLIRNYIDQSGTNVIFGMPDYIGFGTQVPGKDFHTYMVAQDQARATIDFAKALNNISSVTKAGTNWGVVGHSQGGQTAASTAELDPVLGSGNGMTLKGAVALAPAGALTDLVDNTIWLNNSGGSGDRMGSAIIFLANAIFGYDEAYPDVNPSDLLNPAVPIVGYNWLGQPIWGQSPIYRIRDMLKNGSVANQIYQDARVWMINGGTPVDNIPYGATPPNLTTQQIWASIDPARTTWLNTTYGTNWGAASYEFAVPHPNRNISACSYGSLQMMYNYLKAYYANYGITSLEKPGWSTATTGTTPLLMNTGGLLDQNSLGLAASSVPIRMVIGDCDPLAPLTRPPANVGGAVCETILGQNVGPYAYDPVNHPWGAPVNAFLAVCGAGSDVKARIYGEIDMDRDGVVDAGFEEGAGGAPDVHFGHSLSVAGDEYTLSRTLADDFSFLQAAWAGTAGSDC